MPHEQVELECQRCECAHEDVPLRAAPRVSGENEATLESAELDG